VTTPRAAATASADKGDQDQTATAICTAADLGEAIPQIVEQLSQGDARWNPFRAQQKMTVTVVGGDCG
jgi:hypothetical protein